MNYIGIPGKDLSTVKMLYTPCGLRYRLFSDGGHGVILILRILMLLPRDVAYWALLVSVHVFQSCFNILIILLGEEWVSLCVFRTFVCLSCIRQSLYFSLPLSVGDRIRIVIVALPGLFI